MAEREQGTRHSHSTRLARLAEAPEIPVALFSFLLHFVWEFLQVPLYAGLADMPHWSAVVLCGRATLGDVGMALVAFWAASLATRDRGWILRPSLVPVAVFIAAGAVMTIAFEYHATRIAFRWAYAAGIPRVPPFGTGLSPLLQWLVIPPVVIWLARRHLLGAREISRGGA
jgi:hypothetical protein